LLALASGFTVVLAYVFVTAAWGLSGGGGGGFRVWWVAGVEHWGKVRVLGHLSSVPFGWFTSLWGVMVPHCLHPGSSRALRVRVVCVFAPLWGQV
jgi:hypothetical protein